MSTSRKSTLLKLCGTLLNGEPKLALKSSPPALAVVARFLDASIGSQFADSDSRKNLAYGERHSSPSKVVFDQCSTRAGAIPSRVKGYLAAMSRVETAEFEIVGIKESAGLSPTVPNSHSYHLVGARTDMAREEHIGIWKD